MIKSITVKSKQATRKIDLRDPSSSGFALVAMGGLGPVKSDINISSTALSDGGVFNTARTGYRNITIQLLYQPGLVNLTERSAQWYSIEDLRQYTYEIFPNKENITLTIENDKGVYEIDGYVEDNNISIFSKAEGSMISIICPNPYFVDATSSTEKMIVFTGINPMFEFEFGNESLTEKLVEVGDIKQLSMANVLYKGTIEAGVRIVLNFTGDAKNIRIFNLKTSELLTINRSFTTNDSLEINTMKNNKKVTLKQGSITTNVIASLDLMSDWITVRPGDNVLGYVAEEGDNHIEMRVYYSEYCIAI